MIYFFCYYNKSTIFQVRVSLKRFSLYQQKSLLSKFPHNDGLISYYG